MRERITPSVFYRHPHEHRAVEKKKLILSLSITSVVMIVEFIGGFLTNSIALISDAGHMFTHAFAIGISVIAITIAASNPPCHHRTFGLYRTEILAAFINGLFLLLVVGVIIYEAIQRILHPVEVVSLQMLAVAVVGLGVNIASILILRGSHKEDMNVRSVFYHMIADAASSVGVVIAAVMIFYTGWQIIDPLVSIGICAVITYWAWGVLKASTRILLEMAPAGLDTGTIGDDLKASFPEIEEIYDAHLWTITADMLVFSAHVKLDNDILTSVEQQEFTSRMNKHLFDKYKVIESTIQVGSANESEICNIPRSGEKAKQDVMPDHTENSR